jgi:hypothetical protein
MFTAYFDASGKRDQLVLAVAGFVARAEDWIDWEGEWLDRLAQDGLPYFHARELPHWPDWKKARLVEDLSAIIRNRVAFKTGVVVANSHLEKVFSEVQRKQWRMEAYAVAGKTAAQSMRLWAASWGGRIPELVFERGDDGQGQLCDLMASQGYPAPIFKPKKAYKDRKSGIIQEPAIPLQAADLLASELFRRVRAYQRDGHICPDFARLSPNLDKIPGDCGTVESDRLKLIKQAFEESDPDILVPKVKIKTR